MQYVCFLTRKTNGERWRVENQTESRWAPLSGACRHEKRERKPAYNMRATSQMINWINLSDWKTTNFAGTTTVTVTVVLSQTHTHMHTMDYWDQSDASLWWYWRKLFEAQNPTIFFPNWSSVNLVCTNDVSAMGWKKMMGGYWEREWVSTRFFHVLKEEKTVRRLCKIDSVDNGRTIKKDNKTGQLNWWFEQLRQRGDWLAGPWVPQLLPTR